MHRICLLLAFAVTVSAAQMEPAYRSAPRGVVHNERPVLMFAAKPPALISLDAPARSAAHEENQIGVVRQFANASKATGTRGVLSFRSTGAERVRLHLRDVSAQVLWVAGKNGSPVAFGSELLAPDRGIWTPSVAGDTITLEWPDGASFAVDSIGHLQVWPESDACYVGADCQSFPDHDALSSSIAQMTYAKGNGIYVCSGGLIHDKKEANNLFLTANHCISTQAQAASAEFAWDFANSSCGSNNSQSRERLSQGATLLVTSATSDVTLLRVTFPGTRALMGWSTQPPATGTVLRRISHPLSANGSDIFPQVYSQTSVFSGADICTEKPRPQFLYSSPVTGRTGGGSSGAPVIVDGGYIVGQLFGACGENPEEPCDPNLAVDGAFAVSYDLLKPFIDPDATTQCQACTPDANTACVLNNRFKVTLRWRNAFVDPPASGIGTVIRYAENTPETNPTYGVLSENVFFSMFPWAPQRVEAVVKVFKGVGINNYYWVFATGLTNNEYWVDVTDTQTCQTWERYNAHGQFSNLVDVQAFPFP